MNTDTTRTTKKEIISTSGCGTLKISRQAERLENLTLEMYEYKCVLSVVTRWPGKDEIAFYWLVLVLLGGGRSCRIVI